MTKVDLAELLTREARKYSAIACDSVARSRHMNDLPDGTVLFQNVVDAVVVDFVNFVMGKQGMDLGFYTKDLRE